MWTMKMQVQGKPMEMENQTEAGTGSTMIAQRD